MGQGDVVYALVCIPDSYAYYPTTEVLTYQGLRLTEVTPLRLLRCDRYVDLRQAFASLINGPFLVPKCLARSARRASRFVGAHHAARVLHDSCA